MEKQLCKRPLINHRRRSFAIHYVRLRGISSCVRVRMETISRLTTSKVAHRSAAKDKAINRTNICSVRGCVCTHTPGFMAVAAVAKLMRETA